MAIDADIQAVLDPAGYRTKTLIQTFIPGTTNNLFYCTGGVDYPGKARWCTTTTANTASQQATQIQNAMAATS